MTPLAIALDDSRLSAARVVDEREWCFSSRSASASSTVSGNGLGARSARVDATGSRVTNVCFRLCVPSGAVRARPRRGFVGVENCFGSAAGTPPPPPKRSAPQVFARACLPTRGPCPRSMTRAFASASAAAEAEAEAEAPRVVSDEDAASKPRDDASLAFSFSFFSISLLDFEARDETRSNAARFAARSSSVARTPEARFSGNRYRTNTPYVSLSKCKSNGSTETSMASQTGASGGEAARLASMDTKGLSGFRRPSTDDG